MKQFVNQKRRERGITLVALVVTIVIMLILAGVTLNLSLGKNGLIKMARKTVNQYDEAQSEEDERIDQLEKDLNNANNKVNNLKGVNRPKLTEGMIPIKYDTTKKNWVITEANDEDWYDYRNATNLAWANVMLSDGKYKVSNKDKSKEEGGYTDDGTTIVEEGELGSMFVWIPRYAYSITKYHTDSIKNEGTTQGIFNVSFIKGTENKDFEGNKYEYSYETSTVTAGQATPKIVHPAFSFGGNNLSGIWVAKFEASMQGTNNNDNTNDKIVNNEIRVLPNKETWRNISIGNAFMNCLNMNTSGNVYGINERQLDSHLMKNTEWGAVAYLAASQYGVVPTSNEKNEAISSNNQYHSWAGGQNYITNKTQSTTGNVTGIYDMNGGGWDWIAAYYDNGNVNLKTYGKDAFDENNTLKSEYTKYWNKYEVGEAEKTTYKELSSLWNLKNTSTNPTRKELTIARYDKMKEKNNIGDAGYEIIKDKNYAYFGILNDNKTSQWIHYSHDTATSSEVGKGYYNNDEVLIGHCARPFINRGGNWTSDVGSGVFAWDEAGGGPNYSHTFRPVLVA